VLALVVVGLIFHTGSGTPSSFGWREIAAICPLGIIEVFLAEKTLLPRALIVLLVVLGVTVVLGKVFCAWACPVPPLRRIFAFKDRRRISNKTRSVAQELQDAGADANGNRDDGVVASGSVDKPIASGIATGSPTVGCPTTSDIAASNAGCSAGCSSCAEKRAKLDSRHVVLGGALLSTAVFGFPVFCIVCPVGLVFATIIAFWRWVGFDELTLSLLAFPAILAIEVLVLRTWCLKLCPLGAVFSLMSLSNRFLRPKVNEGVCLRNKGIDCNICVEVCEEKLDPHFRDGMHECSKCGECVSHCPAHAIRIPFGSPRRGSGTKPSASNPTTPLDSAS
jgi:ferredoxin-type protein NapH